MGMCTVVAHSGAGSPRLAPTPGMESEGWSRVGGLGEPPCIRGPRVRDPPRKDGKRAKGHRNQLECGPTG